MLRLLVMFKSGAVMSLNRRRFTLLAAPPESRLISPSLQQQTDTEGDQEFYFGAHRKSMKGQSQSGDIYGHLKFRKVKN